MRHTGPRDSSSALKIPFCRASHDACRHKPRITIYTLSCEPHYVWLIPTTLQSCRQNPAPIAPFECVPLICATSRMDNKGAGPTKACHNCRRQRLRCDRSYPQCNKCTRAGKECLGYGNFFRWTGAVASRGKFAGQTAPVASSTSSSTSPSTSSSSWSCGDLAKSPKEESQYDIADSEHQTSSDEEVQLIPRAQPAELELSTPWVLVDPLYQDMGSRHRLYLQYCKYPIENFIDILLTVSYSHYPSLPRPGLLGYTRAQSLSRSHTTDQGTPSPAACHRRGFGSTHVQPAADTACGIYDGRG